MFCGGFYRSHKGVKTTVVLIATNDSPKIQFVNSFELDGNFILTN